MDDAAHGLRVNLDQLVYQDGVLTPPDTPHCFAYYITILDEGQETVTVRGRKWVVTESNGEVIAVEETGWLRFPAPSRASNTTTAVI